MAGAIIPDDGAIGFSDLVMNGIQGGVNTSRVHLFANDYYPDRATVVGSFTEVGYVGYAPQPLPVPANTGIDATGKDVWIFPQSVFTAIGGGLPAVAFGYWVDCLDPISLTTRVLWAQRFFVPQGWLNPGDSIKFTLSWGGKQC